ncbi:Deaminated glutathione amidase [BD1-7 clade bacterium]|uniref:Deaminated glutathione amidase n=1 Tax=BD1-7 clade bacterium TaxID=2029982 RepID=A0A5S9MWB6_9GAMM|nr:Deaminated glutathione amidase [BD1-7 clade bacterium]
MHDSPTLHVAAVQMVSQLSVEHNLQRAKELVAQAASDGAKMVVLPENFACFANREALLMAKNELTKPILVPALAAMASSNQVFLCGGTLPLVANNTETRASAASLMFAPNGSVVARYNKIHLFDAKVGDRLGCYRESDTFAPGNELTVAEVEGFGMGMSVCYDLRFSRLYQQLRASGSDVFLVPSAFTAATGKKHWEVLLRARAIEQQCYVIAANQGGLHDSDRETFGHSMIIDPDGEVISRIERGEGVIHAVLERDRITSIRTAMPCFEHQRCD